MTPVVIDASAGVEILVDTARGRRVAALLPADAVDWAPEHFCVEAAGILRHQTVVARSLSDAMHPRRLSVVRSLELHFVRRIDGRSQITNKTYPHMAVSCPGIDRRFVSRACISSPHRAGDERETASRRVAGEVVGSGFDRR